MPDFDLHNARLKLLFVACASLAGCSSFNGAGNQLAGIITPYKIDVVQGNFVSKEQAAAITPGMTRGQVRGILGSPLLTSIFHADRWDYVFTFKRQGIEPQARRVTVFFKGDLLERVEADALPSEAEFVASLDSGRKTVKVPVLEATEDQLKALSAPPAKEVQAKALPPLPASYPALEAPSR
jgi:outer membrane protein assembly factor BamE